MIRRCLALVGAALISVALIAAPAPATAPLPKAPVDGGARYIDDPYDCEGVAGVGEVVPESIGVSGVTDGGETVALDVLVLVDVDEGASIAADPDLTRREARMDALVAEITGRIEAGKRSYDPLDVDYRLAEFRLLQPLNADGTPRERTTQASAINQLAKDFLGGQRPEGFDVVYTITDLDLQEPGIGNIVAGLADCIGGVRYPDRAFAVGEFSQYEDLQAGPIYFYRRATAKIMAHEIGHLMGAHHHYQDCATGLAEGPDDNPPDYLTPCTLMTNAVDFQSMNFSPLEGAVVRGHAVDFAASNDEDHS